MHSDVFSVIADPTRRRIVRILAEQTHTVGAVVEKLGMSQPTISKHLKVLRDADVVSVTVEGQRRLYSLNPDVFATVTEWINETVQIARQSSEAHVPVALPGGATAPADNKTADKASEKVAEKPAEATEKPAVAAPEKPAEKVAETTSEKPAVEKGVAEPEKKVAEAPPADVSSTEASGPLTVEAPSAEEIEQARIQRARAQYLTPSARIYSRPAEQASESAASESAAEKAQPATESAAAEEAVDSTPMRPFTPASYGYDVGATPAASAEVKPAEAKPVVAEKPVVIAQPASVVSYGIDPAAVVGGSIQPIAVTPEAPAAEEPAVAEKTVEEKPVEKPAEKAEEKTSAEETVVAEESTVEESAPEKAAVEESDKAEGTSESSSEETEYQTMPAYDSVYRPSTETTSTEAKDNHRGGLFGFLRGRRR